MSGKPMKIGLIDVDGHSGFPNRALMRLSAWHKERGDEAILLRKMDAYCQQQIGQTLAEYSAQLMAEEMAPLTGPVM